MIFNFDYDFKIFKKSFSHKSLFLELKLLLVTHKLSIDPIFIGSILFINPKYIEVL